VERGKIHQTKAITAAIQYSAPLLPQAVAAAVHLMLAALLALESLVALVAVAHPQMQQAAQETLLIHRPLKEIMAAMAA
jgi:hypothetical protein